MLIDKGDGPTQSFLHALYALHAKVMFYQHCRRPGSKGDSVKGRVLEIVLAHVFISIISLQTLDTEIGGFLARIEIFTGPLAVLALVRK